MCSEGNFAENTGAGKLLAISDAVADFGLVVYLRGKQYGVHPDPLGNCTLLLDSQFFDRLRRPSKRKVGEK